MKRNQAEAILKSAATDIRDAFNYDPGHSDLDNEQPINITIPLGTWRRLNLALSVLDGRSGD